MKTIETIFRIILFPVSTFIRVQQEGNGKLLFILAMLDGLYSIVNKAVLGNYGENAAYVIFFGLLFSPLWALTYLYITSFVLWILGKALGGRCSFKEMQYSFIYATVPIIFSLLLWIPKIVLLGNSSFYAANPFPSADLRHYYFIVFNLLDILVLLWSVILFVIFNKIVNAYSYVRSVLTIAIMGALFILFASLLNKIS